ncbi:MAG TPA: tyrosine--tRNA ligase [Thermoanaerobaculia bacterium]|nr:tyrosine--tRNA ligase [Thermoanaerobaculia bacterium]
MTSLTEQLDRLRRGSVDLIDEADLARKIARGPVTVKVGFDPSAPDIHLGHTVILRKMRHFQDAGHRVVFVIGDFTAMIGDPSGKKTTRPQLTREEVAANAATYTKQAFKILDAEKTVIDFNDRWLGALGAAGFVRLASRVTVARILERDDFQKRWKAQLPIALHELLYPLAQGYDSVALKADVELGGTDQLFNLLVGRDLMRAEGMEPQVVMTLPLLVGTDGVEKMSKSLGNAIGVLDAPGDMFGKVMSIPDALLWSWYELLTDVPTAEIAARRARVETGQENPRDAKAALGRAIVADFHDAETAARAEEDFRRAFSRGEVPEDVETRTLESADGGPAAKTLVALGLSASMREARRKIAEGALKVYAEGASEPSEVRDPEARLAAPGGATVLRLGRRFIRVAWAG